MKRGVTSPVLSPQARSLWAKSDYGIGEQWLPLYMHMRDAAGVATRLWDQWVPRGVQEMVSGESNLDSATMRRLVSFLVAVHDIGKATPVFQLSGMRFYFSGEGDLSWKPRKAGLDLKLDLAFKRKPTHAVAGEVILGTYLRDHASWSRECASSVSAIVGAHHGRPAIKRDLCDAKEMPSAFGWDSDHIDAWKSVQDELVGYAMGLSGFDPSSVPESFVPAQVESLLAGIVIMSDWIASNAEFFPLIPVLGGLPTGGDGGSDDAWLADREASAWREIGLLPCWRPVSDRFETDDFAQRFGLTESAVPRPVQRAAIDIARSTEEPGIMIVEAPMGEGKTEAALAAAEILAQKTGRGGVCVALPTMATTDAMFERFRRWLDKVPQQPDTDSKSVYLAHGKADLNDEFQGIISSSRSQRYRMDIGRDTDADAPAKGAGFANVANGVIVSEWMRGRKKGMLANFVVCTIDQVLMGALSMKHLSLRHLALVNKVVIIDECHAYDLYMQQYLLRVLEWLGSWRTPVILLSATLPTGLRDALADAYIKGRRSSRPSRDSSKEAGGRGSISSLPDLLARRSFGEDSPVSGSSSTSGSGSISESGFTSESDKGYPLITYSEGDEIHSLEQDPSGRSIDVALSVMLDDIDSLVGLLGDKLADGGCAGVVCDTVGRAQQVFEALSAAFARDEVRLTHSRFIDLDRMSNEEALRTSLGPAATRSSGMRPKRLIVVGTQVLEQSLDIDFDVMITDIAPIDLILQRMGRLHRHARPEGDRPGSLLAARCFVRGIDRFDQGVPAFSSSIEQVYARANLLETLAVVGLTGMGTEASVNLPSDIARLVRAAYGDSTKAMIPAEWLEIYERALDSRAASQESKRQKAGAYLLKGIEYLSENQKTLDGLLQVSSPDEERKIFGRGADAGQRAVRDTQDTVEVLLACMRADGLHLLPWIGDISQGVERGAPIPTDVEPPEHIAKVLSRCAVRLPLAMGQGEELDALIKELEGLCYPIVAEWQESYWLAGTIVLPLEEGPQGVFGFDVMGWRIEYTEQSGLHTVHR